MPPAKRVVPTRFFDALPAAAGLSIRERVSSSMVRTFLLPLGAVADAQVRLYLRLSQYSLLIVPKRTNSPQFRHCQTAGIVSKELRLRRLDAVPATHVSTANPPTGVVLSGYFPRRRREQLSDQMDFSKDCPSYHKAINPAGEFRTPGPTATRAKLVDALLFCLLAVPDRASQHWRATDTARLVAT